MHQRSAVECITTMTFFVGHGYVQGCANVCVVSGGIKVALGQVVLASKDSIFSSLLSVEAAILYRIFVVIPPSEREASIPRPQDGENR